MMHSYVTLAVGLATSVLAVNYAVDALWGWVVAIALIGLLWMVKARRGGGWVSAMALVCLTVAAAVGAILGLSKDLMLFGAVVLLVAWDLEHFAHTLDDVADIRDENGLARVHLQRLGVVAGSGWLLGVVILRVRLTFDFVSALALGTLVIVSLSRAIRYIGRASD